MVVLIELIVMVLLASEFVSEWIEAREFCVNGIILLVFIVGVGC